MAERMFSIGGVIPNLITPFAPGGQVAWGAVQRETAFLDHAGVDGISVGGCLSETSGFTANELFRLCQTVRGCTCKPILAAILPDSELEAMELLDAVCGAGADAVYVAQPHYLFQPGPESLVSMFRRLRARVQVPVLIANILNSAQVELATMLRMTEERVVDGIVQGAGNAHLLVDLLRLRPRVPVFSGVEDLHYVGLMLGAEGFVSDLATLFPVECVGLYRDVREGNHESARLRHEKLLRVWRVLDHPVEQLSRVRMALGAQRREVGVPRHPYAFALVESSRHVADALRREGLATV
jgi:dihydrodipicolinate synthase/N-acetylneuraminate lyase